MIKFLVMDVDGPLTDGKIYMGADGELMKAFNIKDGCGIHDILIPSGIEPIIMTGRISDAVEKRCNELGIKKFYQGVSDKVQKLEDIISKTNTDLSDVAYIGDDINDLQCMEHVKSCGGIIGCPNDANAKVKEVSDYVCKNKGGDGAVREFIEWILNLI